MKMQNFFVFFFAFVVGNKKISFFSSNDFNFADKILQTLFHFTIFIAKNFDLSDALSFLI